MSVVIVSTVTFVLSTMPELTDDLGTKIILLILLLIMIIWWIIHDYILLLLLLSTIIYFNFHYDYLLIILFLFMTIQTQLSFILYSLFPLFKNTKFMINVEILLIYS